MEVADGVVIIGEVEVVAGVVAEDGSRRGDLRTWRLRMTEPGKGQRVVWRRNGHERIEGAFFPLK